MLRSTMILLTLSTGLLALCAAAAAVRDGAVIVDSGSTNTAGYKIDIWSDGSAVITLQNRLGVPAGAPKKFSITATLAQRFFADLKAARNGNAQGTPCMKSASFGTSTHVTWHGWTSPDLDCAPDDPLTKALVRDVSAIRSASGYDSLPLLRHPLGPPMLHVQPVEPAQPSSPPPAPPKE